MRGSVRVHSGRERAAEAAGVRLVAVLDDLGLPYLAAALGRAETAGTLRLFRLRDRVFVTAPAERVNTLDRSKS